MAASLNTLVVSWKDAADIQLVTPREAFVIPNKVGEEVAGFVAGIALLGAIGGGILVYNEIQENQHCETIVDDPNASMDQLSDCY